MRKADSKRVSLKLTQHSYALTPKRSTAYIPGVIAAICAIGALVAAGYALKTSHEQARKLDVLCAPPVSEQSCAKNWPTRSSRCNSRRQRAPRSNSARCKAPRR